MNQNANEKIRNENIKAVFRAVAEDGCRTRSDIALSAGISLVTAGKIVEDLLDTGIFLQRDSASKSIGRHAGRIILDESKNIVSVDLSGRDFSFSVYDMALKQIYFTVEEYMEDLTCAEAICRFLHRVKSFMKRESDRGIRFMALGVIVPGEYDRRRDMVGGLTPRSFEGIRIRDFARSMVGIIPDCVMDQTSAALKYCAEGRGVSGNTLYINISGGIDARLVVEGETMKRCGCVVERVDGEGSLREQAVATALTIMNVCGLERVVVTADMPDDATAVKEILTERLSKKGAGQRIPEIRTLSQHDCACIGMASMLRWQKIERRIKRLL